MDFDGSTDQGAPYFVCIDFESPDRKHGFKDMSRFYRSDPLFSLCGLNCGLCPMFQDHYCPGCGGGPGNQACAIARCSLQHGAIEYCHLCDAFPCEKYDRQGMYDSFITYRHQFQDIQKFQQMGTDAYREELSEKMNILKYLLKHCNDGRRKSFYCLAVNLLELPDLKTVMEIIARDQDATSITLKEKALITVGLLQKMADKRQVTLKLNKKPKGSA